MVKKDKQRIQKLREIDDYTELEHMLNITSSIIQCQNKAEDLKNSLQSF